MYCGADHIEACRQAAQAGASRLEGTALLVPGMTSPFMRHFLNALCGLPDVQYLEIGTLVGATAVSASYGNQGRFTAVDSFQQWPLVDGPAFSHMHGCPWWPAIQGWPTRLVWHRHVTEAGCRVELVERDCFRWDPDRSADVLFYDGDLSREATFQALCRYVPACGPRVLVVDDYHQASVQEGVGLARSELRSEHYVTVEQDWDLPTWQGVYVALLRYPDAE